VLQRNKDKTRSTLFVRSAPGWRAAFDDTSIQPGKEEAGRKARFSRHRITSSGRLQGPAPRRLIVRTAP
jgi:hypothetical protein